MLKMNLSLIKKLVEALEESQSICDNMRNNTDTTDINDFSVEMARSYGICMGIMQEGAALSGDVQEILKSYSSAPLKSGQVDLMQDLLSKIKGNIGGTGGKKLKIIIALLRGKIS